MAERSFAKEVEDLKLGDGQEFHGEGILAITKALLQSGVGYVAGYQGAPISHLMDVLSDAQDILADLGVHFETSASEATAAATLAASVMYPIRGAVTFKSPVGTNVASDALANLASGGVTGGALIIVGEDYGEGSSIMQERSHAYAMKSQIWLLDPRPDLESIVRAVETGFELSEASNTPVMLEVRIRACHVRGSFRTKTNQRPTMSVKDALEAPRRDTGRVVLPPASYVHEKEKIEKRWPAAVKFIKERGLNEFVPGDIGDVGIILQGGMYNGVLRALQGLGLADVWGTSRIPLYVMNVTYPLVPDEVVDFCRNKRAVLLVEEGQPDFIEQALSKILRQARHPDAALGQGPVPHGGRIHRPGHGRGDRRFRAAMDSRHAGAGRARLQRRAGPGREACPRAGRGRAAASARLLHRLPRTADLRRHEAGRARAGTAPRRGRHRLPPVRDHAALQYRHDHHGLRPGAGLGVGLQRQGGQALHRRDGRRRLLAQRAHLGHRQCRVQQERRRGADRRQPLFGGDRRPGPPVVARRQPLALDAACHRRRRQGHGRQLGAPDRSHLRCRPHARHAEGGADQPTSRGRR